jgi:hypothetical protein
VIISSGSKNETKTKQLARVALDLETIEASHHSKISLNFTFTFTNSFYKIWCYSIICYYDMYCLGLQVPQKYQNSHSLGEWVRRQRDRYKNRVDGLASTITDIEIEKLESIGFRWESKMQLIRGDQSDQTSETDEKCNLDNQVSHFRLLL